jgi:hypothetical protein
MEWFKVDDPDNPAPDDCLHIRGLWVHSAETGKRLYWTANCGFLSDDGDFLYCDGDDPGWRAEDYTHWMPLPAPPDA